MLSCSPEIWIICVSGIQSRIHTIACSSTPLSSPLLWIAVYHVLAGILRSSTFTVCLCMVCKKRFDPKCRSSGMHGKLFRHEKLITLCHWTYFEEYLSKYIHNHPQLVVDLVHKVRPKPKWNKPGNDLSFFHMNNTTYSAYTPSSALLLCASLSLLEHHTHRIRIFLRPANFTWYFMFECESKRGHPLLLAYLLTQVLTTRTFLYRTFWKTHWIDGISIRLHTGVIVLTG